MSTTIGNTSWFHCRPKHNRSGTNKGNKFTMMEHKALPMLKKKKKIFGHVYIY